MCWDISPRKKKSSWNINYLFEASCGGGIPIIRPLNSSLTADEIDEAMNRYSVGKKKRAKGNEEV